MKKTAAPTDPKARGNHATAVEPGPTRGRGTAVVFIPVALLTIALDLISKHLIFRHFQDGEPHTFIPGVITIKVSQNPGAAFSLGAGYGVVLIAISLVACVVMVWAVRKYGPGSRALTWALALLFGGALGNVWDRLFHAGHVRDFIDLHAGPYHWPGIFNAADIAICIGCGLIVLTTFRSPAQEETKAAPTRNKRRKKKT